jgi:6-phosphofructokinase
MFSLIAIDEIMANTARKSQVGLFVIVMGKMCADIFTLY